MKNKRFPKVRPIVGRSGFEVPKKLKGRVRLVVYRKYPPNLPLRTIEKPKKNVIHYCPNPYKKHTGMRVPMAKAGGVSSGPNRFIQRWRCKACGFCTTYNGL